MRSTLRTCGILLSCSFLALFLACGGGGSNSPNNNLNVQDPPVATAPTVLPADASLVEYKTYTFSTTATDADIGVTIAKCVWNFGDGTAPVTASASPFSVQHAFATTGSGSFTVSVTPTDSRGIAGNPASTVFSVVAAPNPFVVSINQPTAAVPLSVAVGNTVSLTFDFTVTLASASNGFTYTASGLSFLTNDASNDTVGALTQVAANEWQTTVVFPATANSGTRTFTPTIQVTDTTGHVSSGLVSFPAITINTLPATAPPPTVTLTAAPAILVAGTTNTTYQNVPVTFTATAVDTVVPTMTYSWSFGDGGKGDVTGSTALSLAHTYANPGVYTVVFTADTGIPGAIRSTTMAIQILPDLAPVISFTALPSPYYVGMPITFTATDTVAGQTPTYTWNFGDGSTGTGSPIVHAFMSYVPATVKLTADDGKGGVTTTTQSLNILADVPPVAGAVTGPTGNLYESKAYSFTATASEPSGGNPVTSFIWNWGDGSAAQTDSTHVTALSASTFTDLLTHSFPAGNAATYSVTVQPVDSHGSVGAPSPATVFTVVPTLLPTAAFTAPAAPSTFTLPIGSPVSVTFTISVSNPNGAPGVFLPASALTVYPLGAGNPAVANSVTANGDGTYNATYSYPAGAAPGTVVYTPAAQAVDAQNIVGPVVTGQTVTIKTVAAILPPVVTMTAAPAILAGPGTTYQGVPVQFTATASDPNGDILNYTWTFSDGGKGDVASTTAASALSQTHAFAAPGIYQVVFTATNTLPGGTNSVTRTIQVLPDTAPSISVVVAPASNYYVGAPVTFTVTDATPNQTPTYTWNFGDGSPAVTGSAPTHTFQAAGNTVVTLTADDGKGGVATWTQTLAINADTAPVAQAVVGPTGNLFQSKVYTFTATATELVAGNTVASFIWNWGDGSSSQVDASHIVAGAGGVYTDTLTHAFPAGQAAFNANITVTPVDNHGSVGSASPNTSFPVVATALPVGTFLTPASPTTSSVGIANNLTVTFTFSGTNPNGAPGAFLPASAFTFYPLGSGTLGTTATVTALGGGTYQASYAYTGAGAPGTAVYTPSLQVIDGQGIVGPMVSGQTVTIVTVATINPPVVSLVANPAISAGTDATYQGVPVQFTAAATDPNGDILNYTWTFSDGGKGDVASTTAASALSQTHAFAAPGIYTVTFTASNTLPNGTNSVQVNIQVLPDTPPALTVTLNPSSNFYVGVPVTFNVADSNPGQVPVYTWNFGDGSALATGATVTHTYQAAGQTNVTLTANDGKGGITVYANTLAIQADIVPVAQAVSGPAGNLYQSKSYSFTASATELVPANTVASFIWNWGDGSPAQVDNNVVNAGGGSFTDTVTHVFPAGQPAFLANVTVQPVDNHGAVGVPSPNTAFPVVVTSFPTPQFTIPASASTLTLPLGSQVTVNFVLAVSNPNGAPGTYLPASGVVVYPLGIGTPGVTATVTSNGDGTYNASYSYLAGAAPGSATLIPVALATDGQGIVGPFVPGQAVTVVTVAAINPPVVTMTATPAIVAGANTTYQGVPIQFAATATDPNGDILYYSWDFGDGSSVAQTTSAAVLNQTHAYLNPGIYTVTFSATNTLPGGTNAVTFNIQVLADTKPALTVTLNPAANFFVAAPISFSVVDTTPNQTPIYTWNFGDGSAPVTGAAQVHTFLASGKVVVTLTADDQKGGVTTVTQTLTIQANIVPVAQAVQGPAGNLYQSKTYTFTATAQELVPTNSVTSFTWIWGDGTPNTVDNAPTGPVGNLYTSTMTHVFPAGQASFNANILVVPMDNHGAVGVTSPSTSFPVVATSLPVVTFTQPLAPVSLNVDLNGTVTQTLLFTVSNPQAAVGATDPLPVAGIHLLANDGSGLVSVGTIASLGGGQYSVVITYTGAAVTGSRSSTPTAYAVDSLGIQGLVATAPTITISTRPANHAPAITVTSPASPTASVYTSDTVSITFTLTDADNDPVTYTVDWNDGTTTGPLTTSGNTVTGVPVTLTHVFADSFAAVTNPRTAVATITATDNRSTDNRSTNSLATPKTITYTVTYNTYPTAVITSPQASATIPAAVAALNIPNTDPPVVVLPNNGKVTFLGTTTNPGSAATIPGDGGLTYVWSFPGGVPSSSAQASPGEVTFSGTPGQVTAYLVSFTVLDTFGRSSDQATGVNPNTFKRWVIVDGTDSQTFYLSFLYRQRSGTSSPDTYSYATLGSHGYGDTVTIYQDGISNTYAIANANAPTTIPVRSDVPFWLTVPASIAGDTTDGTNYQLNVPNKHGVDPDLEGPGLARTLSVSEGTAFAFQNWGATAPFNPQLQLTTGSGFGTETNGADQRRFQGNTNLIDNECFGTGVLVLEPNLRWLDRLSVPTTDALPVLTEWVQPPNLITGFSGLQGYQLIPEWFVFLKANETRDYNTQATSPIGGFKSASNPTDLGFVIDDAFNADNASSIHLAVSAIQAFRAPASTLDPYDFDVMKTNLTSPAGATALNDGATPEDDSQGLNTTPVDNGTLTFMNGLVNSAPSGPLAGGLNTVHVIYDANDVDRIPSTSKTYNPFHNRANFGYAEYLWTKVWARPLVVNRTNLSYFDTEVGFSTYPKPQTANLECYATGAPVTTEVIDMPWFFYSNPTQRWPYASGVSPTNSSYDLTVANGGTFDASSPVTEGANTGTNHGVGRFYWTAFTPHYNADTGALISRTWLADGTTGEIPTGIIGSATGDADTAWGLLPPQDTMIDKRSRNLDGTANNGTLGGYRVTWFNPTRDASGNVVPPDFWAIQVISDGKTYMYLVSSNYPRDTQLATSPLMTDARAFLNIDGSTSSTYVPYVPGPPASGSLAGPGYCWFDIPPEVRPAAGTATVTVFGLKSILKNNAIAGARTIDRIEWVEAVKTVTASISTKPGGIDQSFAHKIPFNYAWDIVVVNGASTPVAP